MRMQDIQSRGSSRWHKSVLRLAAWVLCGMLPTAQAGQKAGKAPEGNALFAADTPLEITISAPWREIVRRKRVQSPYPATLQYVDASGQTQTLPLTVERRGISRQKVCEFPPIMLRFSRAEAKASVFRGVRSIKMVTHCDEGAHWEQYYIKEMLAYRIYNLITDISFRVRPLAVTYVDTRVSTRDGPRFAFLIEDDGAVAKRNGLGKIRVASIGPSRLEPSQANRVALFQYLIGNTDWSMLAGVPGGKCCHNSILLGNDARGAILPMPYDFDSSGLVNPPYADTDSSLPIGKVTKRLYRGLCMHNAALEPVRQEYLGKAGQIRDVIDSATGLDKRNRAVALKYLDAFFETIRDPVAFADDITEKCRK